MQEKEDPRFQIKQVVHGGGGAGSGIGGNGGNGGNSNTRNTLISTKTFDQSGADGEAGEDCGNVSINDSITVYAYGGAGASGGLYTSQTGSSGTGGGGYPAAGIGGGGAGAGGADHMNGGGGYSGGVAENCSSGTQVINGISSSKPVIYSAQCSGGSYFSEHKYDNRENFTCLGGKIGGQGGSHINRSTYWGDSGGDGGVAGKGGTIKVSKNANIYAYNGNKYTDETSYESGNNQLEVYAQNGILREVYKINAWWGVKENYSYEYFNKLLGATLLISSDTVSIANSNVEMKNVLIRNEISCGKTGYINRSTSSIYGIGSGAGYIEISNGTYGIID